MSSDNIQPTGARLYWPSPQEYNEAVQTPQSSFADDELKQGSVETNSLGLPRCMSGNFASVFCFRCPTRKVAVRCFLHNVPDQQRRYSAISQFVLSDDLAATVPFAYVDKGINIHGDWYPILKMDWVDGATLNQFVESQLNNGIALNLLASYFKGMTIELRKSGIAHGDLQHDNILISEDELRLVDYDGMYVPALLGWDASELGHPNYQHPAREQNHFGLYLDNFSAWVIYVSIKALSRDPGLFHRLDGGGDCLLFRHCDFTEPEQSLAFRELLQHEDVHIRDGAAALRAMLELPVEAVPPLDLPAPELRRLCQAGSSPPPVPSANLAPAQPNAQASPPAGRFSTSGNKPAWLDDLSAQPSSSGATAAGVANQLPAWLGAQPGSAPAANKSQSQQSAWPGSVQPANNHTMDPLYPNFNSICLHQPFLKGADAQADIVKQLLPGELVLWSKQDDRADLPSVNERFLSMGLIFSVAAIVLVAANWFWVAAIAGFVAFVFWAITQGNHQLSVILTNRRLLYTSIWGSKGQHSRVYSFPLSEISHIEERGFGYFVVAKQINGLKFGTFKHNSILQLGLEPPEFKQLWSHLAAMAGGKTLPPTPIWRPAAPATSAVLSQTPSSPVIAAKVGTAPTVAARPGSAKTGTAPTTTARPGTVTRSAAAASRTASPARSGSGGAKPGTAMSSGAVGVPQKRATAGKGWYPGKAQAWDKAQTGGTGLQPAAQPAHITASAPGAYISIDQAAKLLGVKPNSATKGGAVSPVKSLAVPQVGLSTAPALNARSMPQAGARPSTRVNPGSGTGSVDGIKITIGETGNQAGAYLSIDQAANLLGVRAASPSSSARAFKKRDPI